MSAAEPAGLPEPLPRLVASDLDGTLVRTDGGTSARTRATLARARERGITVAGATGRGPRLLPICLRDMGSADFLVLAQGGFVYQVDGPEPKPLLESRMPGEAVADAVARIERAAGPVLLTVEELTEPYAPLWSEIGFSWPYPEATQPRSRAEMLRNPLVKAFVMSPSMSIDALLDIARRVVPADTCEVSSPGGMVELVPPGRTKASGLALVCELRGIDPADVLVFGDMPNDVSMFEWAGRAVAVAGAHPEVRAVADDVTAGNDEDGVAAYLDRLLDSAPRG